jgi:CBS domain-containing protein
MISTRDTLRVGNLMTLDPIVIAPDEPAAEAERLMKTFRISGLPVVDKDELAGVVSQADLMVARSSEMIGAHWQGMRVRHLMTSPAITVHATVTLAHAAKLMIQRDIHRLVVVGDDGEPIGVLTTLDLLRALTEDPAAP